jgi:hypothetical protein
MKLPTPSAPFSPVYVHGESITIETEGKVLVLPSGNPNILPLNNEYTLNSNRLTIAESPFGGLKGSGSPDYAPGTVNIIEGDGIYLTDINGQNTSKMLSAGKLVELGHLSVDTTNHTITEEFIIENQGAGTDVQVIDACDSTTGWVINTGSEPVFTADTTVKVEGSASVACAGITASTNGSFTINKDVNWDLSGKDFISVQVRSTLAGYLYFKLSSDSSVNHKTWSSSRFPVQANTWTTFIFPIKAPTGTVGSLPDISNGVLNLSAITKVFVGVFTTNKSTAVTFYIDNITACNGTWAKVEVAVPDNLSATSLSLYTHNGTAYQLCSSHSLDSAYALVAQTSANCTLLDSTKLDDVYGTGNGRSVFPKGESGETKTGSSGTITYSQNKGTSRRIGLKVSLPPSDGGRTNFNKCRIKTVISYAADSAGKYSASYQFSDTTSASTGLQNLSKPWIALYDPAKTEIDFFLHTYRPKSLEYKKDESGTIHELKLFPGNGQLYHGRVTHCNPALDSDSNNIPDCLEASIEGSITKFLQSYGMVE